MNQESGGETSTQEYTIEMRFDGALDEDNLISYAFHYESPFFNSTPQSRSFDENSIGLNKSIRLNDSLLSFDQSSAASSSVKKITGQGDDEHLNTAVNYLVSLDDSISTSLVSGTASNIKKSFTFNEEMELSESEPRKQNGSYFGTGNQRNYKIYTEGYFDKPELSDSQKQSNRPRFLPETEPISINSLEEIPDSLRHLHPDKRIKIFDRKRGIVLDKETAPRLGDLSHELAHHIEYEPIMPEIEGTFHHQSGRSENVRIRSSILQQNLSSLPRSKNFVDKCVKVISGKYLGRIGESGHFELL